MEMYLAFYTEHTFEGLFLYATFYTFFPVFCLVPSLPFAPDPFLSTTPTKGEDCVEDCYCCLNQQGLLSNKQGPEESMRQRPAAAVPTESAPPRTIELLWDRVHLENIPVSTQF